MQALLPSVVLQLLRQHSHHVVEKGDDFYSTLCHRSITLSPQTDFSITLKIMSKDVFIFLSVKVCKIYMLSCWSEHFQTISVANCHVQDPAILCIPQLPIREELDEPPIEKIEKQRDSMEFQLRSGSIEVLHYTASSMNSSSAAGNRASYRKIFETQSSSPCTRTRENNLTFPTIGGSPFWPSPVKSLPGYCSTGLCHPSPKNIFRKSLWLQSQQRHNGHGFRSPSTPGEMP